MNFPISMIFTLNSEVEEKIEFSLAKPSIFRKLRQKLPVR